MYPSTLQVCQHCDFYFASTRRFVDPSSGAQSSMQLGVTVNGGGGVIVSLFDFEEKPLRPYRRKLEVLSYVSANSGDLRASTNGRQVDAARLRRQMEVVWISKGPTMMRSEHS